MFEKMNGDGGNYKKVEGKQKRQEQKGYIEFQHWIKNYGEGTSKKSDGGNKWGKKKFKNNVWCYIHIKLG